MHLLIDSIRKTVHKSYACSVTGKTIRLTEDDACAKGKCEWVELEHDGSPLVYKFDQRVKQEGHDVHEPLLLFEATPPIRSKCDYIIFWPKKNKAGDELLYIFVCNLKSHDIGNSPDQIESGKALADYILRTAVRCHNYWHSQKKAEHKVQFETFRIKQVRVVSILFSMKDRRKMPSANLTRKGRNKDRYESAKSLPCGTRIPMASIFS